MITKVLIGIVCLIVVTIIAFVVCCIVTGKGIVEPYRDKDGKVLDGSIAERVFIDVNGRENGLIIRGKNVANPVMIFISGGPGVPEYWLNDYYKSTYPNKIEDEFTVCWWDYRGEGLSYDSDISADEITLDQLTEDATVVCDYLKERFNVPKVYLMAHSGGTMLGMNLAVQKPEYFYCYIAMGQVVNLGYGRHEAGYNYMKSYFESTGQKDKLKKLENMVETRDGHIRLKEKYNDGNWEKMLLSAGCGTTREMRSDVKDIFFPQMFSHCYTFTEKINYWKGKKLLSQSPYFKESEKVYDNLDLSIPIIFLSGTYDYTTPITYVTDLFERINAPKKYMFEYDESAHSPLWEENDKVMKDILYVISTDSSCR